MSLDDLDAGSGDLDKNHDAYFVPGLFRGLHVLEALAESQRSLSVSDISRALKITRSSAFRLIYTLRHMGFVENEPNTKNVRLGSRVLSLGFSYLSRMDIIEHARPDLDLLRDNTGITAHLGIRDGRDLLYLACAHTRTGFISTINVGSRFPVHMTPMGWLLLSDLSPRELAQMFPEPYAALTEQSPQTLGELMQRVSLAGAEGVVVSHGIMEKGGSSICAPVYNAENHVVACIDISGPDGGFNPELIDSYKSELLAAAARISTRLGHQASRKALRLS